MGIQDQLNQYRGGQLLNIEMISGEMIQCKLEMKVYNTISLPITISSIIVSLVDDEGNRMEEENFYEKEIPVDQLKQISPLELPTT